MLRAFGSVVHSQFKSKLYKRKQSKRFRPAEQQKEVDEDNNQRLRLSLLESRTSREAIPKWKFLSDLSRVMYPDVPHEWLCDGKLLVLTDPSNKKNIDIFKVSDEFFVKYLIEVKEITYTVLYFSRSNGFGANQWW